MPTKNKIPIEPAQDATHHPRTNSLPTAKAMYIEAKFVLTYGKAITKFNRLIASMAGVLGFEAVGRPALEGNTRGGHAATQG
jgi:hypothetical protein